MLAVFSSQHWTEKYAGLWQTQPRDFLLEKAFNKLMAEEGSRCCVCSLFDVSSPFATFDPASLRRLHYQLQQGPRNRPKLRTLKVVVRRALITLPDSLAAKGVDEMGLSDSEEENSELITCQSCSICVHRCKSRSSRDVF